MVKAVDYDEGKRLEQTRVCTCGGKLSLCWGGFYGINSFVLRCAKSNEHSEIMRPAELGPYDIPGFPYNLKGRYKDMVEQLGEEKAKALQPYTQVGALTKNQAKEILKTIWPEAPDVEILKSAIICRQYGLNPLMRHIFLMPFKHYNKSGEVTRVDWATHIGIKANRLIARRADAYSYMDNTPRMMTKAEQEAINGVYDEKNFWAITKLRGSQGNEAQGYGSWSKDQSVYGAEKGNTPQNMAMIHSERNALDRLLPGEMPQNVGVIDEQYIEGDYKVLESDQKSTLISPAPAGKALARTTDIAGNESARTTKAARTQKAKQAENKVGESAQRATNQQPGQGGDKSKATPSGADEHTLVSATTSTEMDATSREAAAAERVGFISDIPWVMETMKAIKWTAGTARSWIIGRWPEIQDDPDLKVVLGRLSLEQAGIFCKELKTRLDSQPKLFK